MNYHSVLQAAVPGLLTSILVMIIAWLFHPPLPLFLAGGLALNLATMIWRAAKADWQAPRFDKILIRSSAGMAIFVIIIATLEYLLGGYGFIGLLLIVLGIAAWRLYNSWDLYMDAIRTVERGVWGATAEERRRRKE